MGVLECLYWIISICTVYLIILLANGRYRLLLPSTVHTFTWLVCAVLMLSEVKGWIRAEPLPVSKYEYVCPYMLGMIVASVIAFIIAHQVTIPKEIALRSKPAKLLTVDQLNMFLKRFFWIPVLCLVVGLVMTYFFFSLGGFDTFADYRIMAVSVEKVGYAAIAKRLSGHVSILGLFYMIIVGYKQGISGINLKEFLKYLIMIGAVNMSIGGRLWLLTTLLPYLSGILLAHSMREDHISLSKSMSKLFLIGIILVSLFSILGRLRSSDEYNKQTTIFSKFLYYTDGPKMANMVLKQYPPGSFELEYGKSTFLGNWIKSPMQERFANSIKYDRGLSVTVKSLIPNQYYDFGYWGGIVMWGVFCFILEMACLNLRFKNNFLSIILFGALSLILFQAPIGNIMFTIVSTLEWLILISFLSEWIFKPSYYETKEEINSSNHIVIN